MKTTVRLSRGETGLIGATLVVMFATAASGQDHAEDGPRGPAPVVAVAASTQSNVRSFRIDTHPELDFYQPCNGGDNVIAFPINISGVDLAAVRAARLTMAVFDVDFDCGIHCNGVCERDIVFVNGHQLTTPSPFLTGAHQQWSAVTFDVDPARLVTGDNLIRLVIDTLSSTCWCVSCDWAELTLELGAPQIEEIEIVEEFFPGSFRDLKNPMTTKNVTFRTRLANMEGHEVVRINWAGDITPGEGNPYTLKPAAGTHGPNKNVTATLTYRRIGSAETATHSRSRNFNLYFVKSERGSSFLERMGDDDNDGIANWFEYWSSSRDAACSFDAASAGFAYGGGGPTHATRGSYDAGVITLYDSAAMACDFVNDPGTGIMLMQQGIDCVEVVVRHEQEHANIEARLAPGGAWFGLPDTDGDRIPDEVEQARAGFDPAQEFSFPAYCCGNDEEVYVMQVAQAAQVSGIGANDWARPGKNSTPSFLRVITETGGRASLTGVVTDRLVDANQNGKAENLGLDVQVNVSLGGSYRIFVKIVDPAGNITAAERTVVLNPGLQAVTLPFDGNLLRERRVNGPFEVERLILYGATAVEERANVHTTQPYAHADFDAAASVIRGNISELGTDSNGNTLLDALEFGVDILVAASNQVTLDGFLHAADGTPISYLKSTQSLAAGAHRMTLVADGRTIRKSKAQGPYTLRSLSLFEGEERADFVLAAHQSQNYALTDFEGGLAEFSFLSGITDQGVDLNGNGFFDVLRIGVPINATTEGNFSVLARLFDRAGNSIQDLTVTAAFAPGSNWVVLDFTGQTLRLHAQPGPYVLRYAFLFDTNGVLADALPGYQTTVYQFWNFEPPSVALNGQYTDAPVDFNGDGTNEFLNVTVGVYVQNTGRYALNARLMDRAGGEVVWASTVAPLAGGTNHVLTLQFDGAALYRHCSNAPFRLRDVYVYNEADTRQADGIFDTYLTTTVWCAGNGEPVADAGPDRTVPCSGTLTQVMLDGRASSDPDGDALSYTWSEGGVVLGTGAMLPANLALGAHVITLTVADSAASSEDTVTIRVVDSAPPILACPTNITVAFSGPAGAVVTWQITATDVCSVVTQQVCHPMPGSVFPIGCTIVNCSATDASGNAASCSFQVCVLGALGVKRDCLEALAALRVSVTNAACARGLENAIRHWSNSLAANLWLDETHLNGRAGEAVFAEDKQIIDELLALVEAPGHDDDDNDGSYWRDPEDRDHWHYAAGERRGSERGQCQLARATVQGFIECVLKTDRLLAIIAVDAAEAAGAKPKKVAQDRQEIARGDRDAARGKYEQAINHYRNAWKHAVRLQIKGRPQWVNGSLRIEFLVGANETYEIHASTNLTDWTIIGTVRPDDQGQISFDDPGAQRHRSRYYRVMPRNP